MTARTGARIRIVNRGRDLRSDRRAAPSESRARTILPGSPLNRVPSRRYWGTREQRLARWNPIPRLREFSERTGARAPGAPPLAAGLGDVLLPASTTSSHFYRAYDLGEIATSASSRESLGAVGDFASIAESAAPSVCASYDFLIAPES